MTNTFFSAMQMCKKKVKIEKEREREKDDVLFCFSHRKDSLFFLLILLSKRKRMRENQIVIL